MRYYFKYKSSISNVKLKHNTNGLLFNHYIRKIFNQIIMICHFREGGIFQV